VRTGAAEQAQAAAAVSRQMENVSVLAGSIDDATHDQSRGVAEVLAAVGEVGSIAAANAARVGDLDLEVEALTRQTGALEGEVGQFVVGDECLRTATRSHRAAESEERNREFAPAGQTAAEPAG
jgi:methyl-accepting chemotaxis protein